MNPKVYNACVLTSVALIAGGIGFFSIPIAMITTGALVLGLTVFAAFRGGR